jgi:hypothetical protein
MKVAGVAVQPPDTWCQPVSYRQQIVESARHKIRKDQKSKTTEGVTGHATYCYVRNDIPPFPGRVQETIILLAAL